MSEPIYPIISRAEARKQGLKFYFTGKICRNGHTSIKYTNGGCVKCYDEYLKSDRCKIVRKKHATTNKGKRSSKKYRESNKGKITKKESDKKYQKTIKYKKCRSEYDKIRKLIDPLWKLKGNIRSLIIGSMKLVGFKKATKTASILGCSFEEFKSHIENQFQEGMTWDNQGKWHYDHIYPISKARDEAHMIELNHYTNFQPLWAIDNIKKSNKV